MILKYAVFTLIVSILPMVIILQDFSFSCVNFLLETLPILNSELISKVLSSGLFTYFSLGPNSDEKVISSHEVSPKQEIIFSKEILTDFNGKKRESLYLAILGSVFDVTKGAKYYGPGESYNVFTGRDGSRAFITGDFTETGLTDDVGDLNLQELRNLNNWLQFYHKEYTYKGKLIGRYYDENGNPTKHFHTLQLRIQEAERDEEDKNKYKLMFPPCNVEWTSEEGSRVWCTNLSGGIKRDWVGVPRKFFEPGAETYRCACINTSEQKQDTISVIGKNRLGNLEEYEDCHSKSTSCFVK